MAGTQGPSQRRAAARGPYGRGGIAIVAVLLVLGALLMPHRWLVLNDVTTGRTSAYPEVQPHRYTAPPERVFAAAREAIAGMRRWKSVGEDPGARRISAEIRTFLFGFVDDVTIWIEPDGDGSRVMIRSHSRVGKGDLGENARTIRALQREMDRRLGGFKVS